jgi:transposase-like protein
MGEHRRKSDGRRHQKFKRTTVQRILSGETTLAELSRNLDTSSGVIRNWKRPIFCSGALSTEHRQDSGLLTAVSHNEARRLSSAWTGPGEAYCE